MDEKERWASNFGGVSRVDFNNTCETIYGINRKLYLCLYVSRYILWNNIAGNFEFLYNSQRNSPISNFKKIGQRV
jgi:hypothetical protein